MSKSHVGRLKESIGVAESGAWVVWRSAMVSGHMIYQSQAACDAWNVWRDAPGGIDPYTRPLSRAYVGELPIPQPLNDVVIGYLTAALWSTHDYRYPEGEEVDGDDYNGEPFDSWAGIEDCTDRLIVHALADCSAVMAEVGKAFDRYCARIGSAGDGSSAAERFGHDFWLTREGHGCGFWDRGLDTLGEYLSDVARRYGSVSLYSQPVAGAEDEVEEREVTS